MGTLFSKHTKVSLPILLGLALSLACSRLPLGGQPIPGPATVAAGITQTFVAGQGQAVGAATPTTAPDATRPPAGAPTDSAADGGARPRLAPGQPANIIRLNMLDAATGWAVGFAPNDPSEYVLRTTDGGQTWVDVSPPVAPGTPWAATAFFLDANQAWVTLAHAEAPPLSGTPAVVWHTQDAGQNWSPSQPLNLSDAEYSAPSHLLFVDNLRGWLLTHVGAGMNHDYVMLFATGDGGQTWSRLADPLSTAPNGLPMSCGKTDLAFLDAQTGWVAGDCHGVAPGVYFHRTADGGLTWQPQVLPPPPGAANLFSLETVGCGTYSLRPLPPQTLKAAVYCQDFVSGEVTVWIYSSADAGQNWDASPLPGRDLFFLDANTVWSAAEGDVNDPNAPRHLYRSDDGGQSWADITTVNWGPQLDFIDANTGWAVARAGEELALVHSTDAGANWQLLNPTTGP